jgi:hypothetical protein
MKNVFIILATVFVLASCSKKPDHFVWNKDQIGHITKTTQVYQIDSIYSNDSIVNRIKGDEFSNGANQIEIFEKGGEHLLSLTPSEALDSTATIENIIIRDSRYKTDKGITINSTFKQIDTAYKVTGIDNMIDDAVIWVDDQNFYFSISKEKLPSEVKYDMSSTVEKTMIPDDVMPQYVFVAW